MVSEMKRVKESTCMSKRASKDMSRVYLQHVLVNAYENNGVRCTVEENTVNGTCAYKKIFNL